MIEFCSMNEFKKLGFEFFDLFDEALFCYLIRRDGLVYFDPVKCAICDINKCFCFYVKINYINDCSRF